MVRETTTKLARGVIIFLCDVGNWDTTTWQHKYLKYSGTTPLTRLYCQAFGAPYSDKVFVKGRLKPMDGYNQKMDPFIATVTPRDQKSKSKGWKPNIIVVYHQLLQDLRGCNLFTGKFLAASSISTVTSPLQLVKTNDPWTMTAANDWLNAPGLYIVG